MPPAAKRRKLSDDEDSSREDTKSDVESSPEESVLESDAEMLSDGDEGRDTEDEIAEAKRAKSKKTSKRKHRATDSTNFGATLQSLLSTETPSSLPLSLKPSLARKRNDEKLEQKARKVLRGERKEKEDTNHISDVIGGWGAESERALRKVAQRGVVKLFNAIQQSQHAAEEAADEAKAGRGSGKPSLPAPILDKKVKGNKKGKQKDNIIGRGKEANLDKDGFLDMIRSGGIVSKG